MPENQDLTMSINFCFTHNQLIDYDRYMEYIKSERVHISLSSDEIELHQDPYFNYGLTIRTRFDLSIDTTRLFDDDVLRFVYGEFICYHIANSSDYEESFPLSRLTNVTIMIIGYSLEYPKIDYHRMRFIFGANKMDKSVLAILTSNVYSMKRLQSPYTDHCVNHEFNQQVANRRCVNDLYREKNMVYQRFTVTESDTQYMNFTVSENDIVDEKPCENILDYVDCYEPSIFTYVEQENIHLESDDESYLVVQASSSNVPSFVIESKARIDNIDYVTYIFGAMGSWIGFCFLQINPIPIIFKRVDIEASHDDDVSVNRNRLLKFERAARIRYSKYDHDIAVSGNEIAALKHTVSQLINQMSNLQNQNI